VPGMLGGDFDDGLWIGASCVGVLGLRRGHFGCGCRVGSGTVGRAPCAEGGLVACVCCGSVWVGGGGGGGGGWE